MLFGILFGVTLKINRVSTKKWPRILKIIIFLLEITTETETETSSDSPSSDSPWPDYKLGVLGGSKSSNQNCVCGCRCEPPFTVPTTCNTTSLPAILDGVSTITNEAYCTCSCECDSSCNSTASTTTIETKPITSTLEPIVDESTTTGTPLTSIFFSRY